MAGPIVVGTDPDRCSRAAVTWAAAEAERRRLPLRLLCARERSPARRPSVSSPSLPHRGPRMGGGAAARALSQETAWLYAHHPEVEFSTDLVMGPPVPLLRRQTRTATMLVLGSRRANTLRGLAGTARTALPVIAQAACPVVVVRDSVLSRRRSPHIVAAVNVGWDGRRHSEAAVDHAFEEAARRRTALRVLYVWRPPVLGVLDEQAALRDCRRLLSETVARRQAFHPKVAVQQAVIRGHPFQVLVRESSNALELVVGTRGHDSSTGQLFGRVVHRVLLGAACPVVVVPRPGGRRLPHERPRVSRLSQLTRRVAALGARRLLLLTRVPALRRKRRRRHPGRSR